MDIQKIQIRSHPYPSKKFHTRKKLSNHICRILTLQEKGLLVAVNEHLRKPSLQNIVVVTTSATVEAIAEAFSHSLVADKKPRYFAIVLKLRKELRFIIRL